MKSCGSEKKKEKDEFESWLSARKLYQQQADCTKGPVGCNHSHLFSLMQGLSCSSSLSSQCCVYIKCQQNVPTPPLCHGIMGYYHIIAAATTFAQLLLPSDLQRKAAQLEQQEQGEPQTLTAHSLFYLLYPCSALLL